jgi:hypothetical protein
MEAIVVPMVFSEGCKREAGTSRRAPRHCIRQGQHGVHLIWIITTGNSSLEGRAERSQS